MKQRRDWTATLSMWGRASAAFGRGGLASWNGVSPHALQRMKHEGHGVSRVGGIRHLLEHHVGQTDDAGASPAAYDGSGRTA
jgi:hypothetical protein